MAQESDPQFSMTLPAKSREIAQRIVGIHETTRRQFARIIGRSIDEGQTITETAQRLRTELTAFQRHRINTIARTELMQAWTDGSVATFQESETLTHVSVIGCESREPERWGQSSYQQFMYRGESTCNIEDVPVQDADKLRFHPNHTGTVVPSRFRER